MRNNQMSLYQYWRMSMFDDNDFVNLDKYDLETLIDFALEIGDKDWFMELTLRYKAVSK